MGQYGIINSFTASDTVFETEYKYTIKYVDDRDANNFYNTNTQDIINKIMFNNKIHFETNFRVEDVYDMASRFGEIKSFKMKKNKYTNKNVTWTER